MSLEVPKLGAEAFFNHFECEHLTRDYRCLAELIYRWMSDHRASAVNDACGDFQIWLTIIWLISSRWQDNRFLQDEPTDTTPIIPWHITRMLCHDRQCEGEKIFDPYLFAFFKANPE